MKEGGEKVKVYKDDACATLVEIYAPRDNTGIGTKGKAAADP